MEIQKVTDILIKSFSYNQTNEAIVFDATEEFHLKKLGIRYMHLLEIFFLPSIDQIKASELNRNMIEKKYIEKYCELTYQIDINKLALEFHKNKEKGFVS